MSKALRNLTSDMQVLIRIKNTFLNLMIHRKLKLEGHFIICMCIYLKDILLFVYVFS